jgi:molybdopterin/thiamine biosynthesis adenylyltransferase/rhodanese-related sulfurtransferase
MNDVREISVQDAYRLIRDKNAHVRLVDIREKEELATGYVEDAAFAPNSLINTKAAELFPEKHVRLVLYCASGRRSLIAAKMLRDMGYTDVTSMAGGFNAWVEAGYKFKTDGVMTQDQIKRYSRQILLHEIGEEGQLRLMRARVLLAGAGGLGCPAGLYLASAGVGTIGIVDSDKVDLSNIHRQVLHTTADIGRLKTDSAKDAIRRINPEVNVITYQERLTPDNALKIVNDFDIIIDGSDNFETKFLLNDTSFFAGKPYIFGGAVRFDGQASVFYPKGGGPCLRCMIPEIPPADSALTCGEVGVLGVVPGQIGLVQAAEALKLILKKGKSLMGRFYVYDCLEGDFKTFIIDRNPSCPLCGQNPTIRDLSGNYGGRCKRRQ